MPQDYAPQRVVCLQPSATSILEHLGLLDRVVACTRSCLQLCPAATGRKLVEDSWTARSSEIAAAAPDLVIAAVPFQTAAVSEILQAGARFLGLAPHSLADIYGDIAILAHLFGREQAGNALIESMKQAIADEHRRGRETARPPLVYCEEWGKPLLLSQLWVAELVEAAGGRFFGSPATPTSAQEVAVADPDVIVMAWCGAGDRVPLEKVVTDRNWTGLRAVREGRVYCIRDELLTTPAPVLIKGLKVLAAAIHSETNGVDGLRQIRTLSAAGHTGNPRATSHVADGS